MPARAARPRRVHSGSTWSASGGPGMSAIAIALAEMGHTVSGAISASARCSIACAPPASTCTSATTARTSTAATPSRRRPRYRRPQRAGRGRRLGHPDAQPGRDARVDLRLARSLGVAGTHGKTTTTSMLMLILAEAGLRPSFVIGGDVTDMGTGAQWTGGEWFVVEADESDGTHLELPLHGTILTNVETDHLDHYGSLARDRRRFRPLPGADPRSEGRVRRRPRSRAARRPARQRSRTDVGSRCRRAAPSTSHAERGSFTFTVERDGRPSASTIRLPLRGMHNVLNATGAIAMALELGVDFEVAAACARQVRRRRPPVRHPRQPMPGSTLVDDYAHLPSEIAAVLGAARDSGDAGSASSPCSNRTATTAWPSCRPSTPTRSSMPTSSCSPTSMPSGHAADPRRHRASSSSTPCSTPTRRARVVWLPASRRPDRLPRPRAPRRRRLHLDGLRRHRLAARRGARPTRGAHRATSRRRAHRRRSRWTIVRSRRPPRCSARRAARVDVPLAPMTTYQVGGSAACSSTSASIDDLRRVAAVRARPACRCSSSAVVRTCWSPTTASRASRSRSPASRTAIAIEAGRRRRPRASSPPAVASRCRCWPAARQRPASPGSNGPSAFRDRSAARCG